MRCPVCGATCVCRRRGEDGRCCSCHKHKGAAAHRAYEEQLFRAQFIERYKEQNDAWILRGPQFP